MLEIVLLLLALSVLFDKLVVFLLALVILLVELEIFLVELVVFVLFAIVTFVFVGLSITLLVPPIIKEVLDGLFGLVYRFLFFI